MKDLLTSFDIRALVHEMQNLSGGIIENIYHQGEEFFIKIRSPESMMYIKLGKPMWICLTEKKPEIKFPSSFAMQLRKHLNGSRIHSIKQHKFERIIEFTLERDGRCKLIIELFSHGNVILVQDGRITGCFRSEVWKERTIKVGAPYIYPPERANPCEINLADFQSILSSQPSAPVSRILAVQLNLGREYAERVCENAKIGILMPAGMLNEMDIRNLFESMNGILSSVEKPEPIVAYHQGKPVDFSPSPQPMPAWIEIRHMENMSKAIEMYFSSFLQESERKVEEKKIEEKRKRLERQIKAQEENIKRLECEMDCAKITGNTISSNRIEIEGLISAVSRIRKEEGWEGVERRLGRELANLVGVRKDEGIIEVLLDNNKIPIDIRLSAAENANAYYEKAKKFRDKLIGARAAYNETLRMLEEERTEVKEKAAEPKKAEPKRFWFEKYRWLWTSGGHLVIAGYDAKSNEEVVKRHMGPKDRYAHADIHGATSVVLREEGREITEVDLKEACYFAAAYSKAWRSGIAVDAYWVMPDQVSKTPEAGEYLPKGAFVIRGKKNFYRRIPLKVAIGEIYLDDSGNPTMAGRIKKIVGGPEEAVSRWTNHYFVLEAWNKNKMEAAKMIAEAFGCSIDQVMRAIPGDCRIVKEVKE